MGQTPLLLILCCCSEHNFQVLNHLQYVKQMESTSMKEGTAVDAMQEAIAPGRVGEYEVAVGEGIVSPNNEDGQPRDQQGIFQIIRVLVCSMVP